MTKQIQIADYLLSKEKRNGVYTYTLEPLSKEDPRWNSKTVTSSFRELSSPVLSSLGFSNQEGIWKLPIETKSTYFKEVQVNTRLGIIGFVHRVQGEQVSFPGIKSISDLRMLYKFITEQDFDY